MRVGAGGRVDDHRDGRGFGHFAQTLQEDVAALIRQIPLEQDELWSRRASARSLGKVGDRLGSVGGRVQSCVWSKRLEPLLHLQNETEIVLHQQDFECHWSFAPTPAMFLDRSPTKWSCNRWSAIGGAGALAKASTRDDLSPQSGTFASLRYLALRILPSTNYGISARNEGGGGFRQGVHLGGRMSLCELPIWLLVASSHQPETTDSPLNGADGAIALTGRFCEAVAHHAGHRSRDCGLQPAWVRHVAK